MEDGGWRIEGHPTKILGKHSLFSKGVESSRILICNSQERR